MPTRLEQGMGDCIQTEVLTDVDFLKTTNVYPLNGEQVYKVGENLYREFFAK